jgi:hypothetical protein
VIAGRTGLVILRLWPLNNLNLAAKRPTTCFDNIRSKIQKYRHNGYQILQYDREKALTQVQTGLDFKNSDPSALSKRRKTIQRPKNEGTLLIWEPLTFLGRWLSKT